MKKYFETQIHTMGLERDSDGKIWQIAPVGDNGIYNYKSVYEVTGKLMYAVHGSQLVKHTYIFLTDDTSVLDSDYCVDYLRRIYGADLTPPLPIGAMVGFELVKGVIDTH